MQHPDEGTIHAWLDGALNAGDARAFEAHVAECVQCAAAVTEARGLLAASSRILSALDSVPGGVLPAIEPGTGSDERVIPIGRSPRWRSPGWRAAAAIVLVGSVSWLATRSVGDRAERNLSSPAEVSSAAVSSPTPKSARAEADSIAPVREQSAPPSAPAVAQSAGRGAARGSASTAGPVKPVVPPAPAPQLAVAPQVMPYAMPKLAASPNAGAVGGLGGSATMTARAAKTAPTAQAVSPGAGTNAALREESRVADAELSMRGAANAAARMKSSAPSAGSGAASPMAAASRLDAEAERLAGCYHMDNAASQSKLPGIRAAAALVPAQVELLPDRDPSAGGNWRLLRPAPGAPPFRLAARASWLVLGADSVKLELGEGMQSLTARMRVKGDSIHGYATVTDPLLPGGEIGTGLRGSRMLCTSP